MFHDMDPLELFDLKDLNKLKAALKRDWPRSILVHQWITTRLEWDVQELNQHSYSICSPEGDINNGLVTFGRVGEKMVYMTVYNIGNDLTKLRKALIETKRIDWSEKPICGIPEELVPWFNEIMQNVGYSLHFDDPSNYYWMPKDTTKNIQLKCPYDVYIAELHKNDIPVINNLWPHKFHNSEEYLRNLLRLNYGYGVYSKSTNELLSWGLKYEYADIGVLQTKKEHQKKGYASLIVNALSIQKARDGEDPYAFIIKGNTSSEKLFKKLGFEFAGSYNWLEYE